MVIWQSIVLATLVALPFLLLADFHPRRERLDSRGKPLPRPWRP